MATKHWNLSLATKQDVSPLTTKLGTSHWPPSKMLPHWPPSMEHFRGHQAWNLPLTTKLGFSLTSFLPLLLKNTNLDHLSFFSYVIFDLNIWKLVLTWYLTLFSQFKIWVVNVAWFWKFVQSFFSFFIGGSSLFLLSPHFCCVDKRSFCMSSNKTLIGFIFQSKIKE
jgi:hypothetical protein